MNPHERMISDPELYPVEWTQAIIRKCPDYMEMSPRKKEHMMRRIMSCALLCNLTPSNLRDFEAQEPAQGSSSSSSGTLDLDHNLYRFYAISCLTNVSSFAPQLYPVLEVNCDIWDRVERIPILVLFNHPNISNKVLEVPCAVVDPVTCKVITRHCGLTEQGIMKCVDFISRRRSRMTEMGLPVSLVDYEGDVSETYQLPPLLKAKLENWTGKFFNLRVPLIDTPLGERQMIDGINLKEIYTSISDPRERFNAPLVKWKGKILPPHMCTLMSSNDREDFVLVKQWIDFDRYDDENWAISIIRELRESMEREEATAFKAVPVETASALLRSKLGIGRKTRKRDDSNTETKQPPKKSSPPLRYCPWFDELVRDLSCLSDDPTPTHRWYSDPNPNGEHPMAKLCTDMFDDVEEVIRQSNAYQFASVIKGFFSRIGGAFRSCSGIGAFPILYTDKDMTRQVQGICVLAPPHPSRPGDKVMFLTIERIRDDARSKKMASEMCNGLLFHTDTYSYFARINSVMKEDAGHQMFVNSSSFLVMNMLGELFIEDSSRTDTGRLYESFTAFITNYPQWITQRYTESVLQAHLGRSEEEGTLAACRKLFMIMFGLYKGKAALSFGIGEFIEKLNECLLFSPLAMYWACSYIDSMKLLHEKLMVTNTAYRNFVNAEIVPQNP